VNNTIDNERVGVLLQGVLKDRFYTEATRNDRINDWMSSIPNLSFENATDMVEHYENLSELLVNRGCNYPLTHSDIW
jgi:hypothetical protein